MAKRISDEERILYYFERSSLDAAQAMVKMINALLKRRQDGSVIHSTAIPKRKGKASDRASTEMREVSASDHGAA